MSLDAETKCNNNNNSGGGLLNQHLNYNLISLLNATTATNTNQEQQQIELNNEILIKTSPSTSPKLTLTPSSDNEILMQANRKTPNEDNNNNKKQIVNTTKKQRLNNKIAKTTKNGQKVQDHVIYQSS